MHAGLRNDHKALMKTIEQQLYQLHAEARERGVVSQPDSGRQDKNQQMNTFATVVSVVDRSPAADSVRDTLGSLILIVQSFPTGSMHW